MDYPIRLADQLRAHLRSLRKQRGLTQAQLGQHLGLSQVRIAEIEARPRLVSVDQLMRILSTLGVTLTLRDPASAAGEPAPAARAGTPRRPPTQATPLTKARSHTRKKKPAAEPRAKPGPKGSW